MSLHPKQTAQPNHVHMPALSELESSVETVRAIDESHPTQTAESYADPLLERTRSVTLRCR